MSAHVGHNTVSPEALPGLIHTIYRTLAGLTVPEPEPEPPKSGVPLSRLVFPDYIVHFPSGGRYGIAAQSRAASSRAR